MDRRFSGRLDYRIGAGVIVCMLLAGIDCTNTVQPDDDYEPPQPAVIQGTVADTAGVAVDGAIVTALLDGVGVATDTTEGGGFFSMEVTNLGAYAVTAVGKTGLTAFAGVDSIDAVEGETGTVPFSVKDLHTLALASPLGDLNATAGSPVTLPGLDWQVWSREGCPGCLHTIVVGLDGTPEATLLLSVPGLYPGASGTEAFQLTAPSTPGTYTIWAVRFAAGTDDALALYTDRFPSQSRIDTEFLEIGTLTVQAPDAIVLSDAFEGGCGNWTASASINGSGSTSETCPSSGGSDGGTYREMTHILTDVSNLVVDHTYTGGTVEVGSGGGTATCVATVRFTEQRIVSSPAFPGAGVGGGVWIVQNGTRYRAEAGAFTNTTWAAYDSGELTAAAFTPAGLDLCPAAASALTFGYSRSNTNNSVGVQQNAHGIDQWSVTLVPQPPGASGSSSSGSGLSP